jgi:ABC-type antimicrobial peptide transport system permease subunit
MSDELGLGTGASVTVDGLRAAVPTGAPPPDSMLLRFREGVDTKAALARVTTEVGPPGAYAVILAQQPTDLVNFGRVQNLPLILGGLLGVLAALTLAHLLVTSIRRRRRDLAVLKAVGFTSRQVRRTITWQSSTVATIAALIGIPIGMAIGRTAWTVFADQLGVIAHPETPALQLFGLLVAALVVANVIGLVPARLAGRAQPAELFRAE